MHERTHTQVAVFQFLYLLHNCIQVICMKYSIPPPLLPSLVYSLSLCACMRGSRDLTVCRSLRYAGCVNGGPHPWRNCDDCDCNTTDIINCRLPYSHTHHTPTPPHHHQSAQVSGLSSARHALIRNVSPLITSYRFTEISVIM